MSIDAAGSPQQRAQRLRQQGPDDAPVRRVLPAVTTARPQSAGTHSAGDKKRSKTGAAQNGRHGSITSMGVGDDVLHLEETLRQQQHIQFQVQQLQQHRKKPDPVTSSSSRPCSVMLVHPSSAQSRDGNRSPIGRADSSRSSGRLHASLPSRSGSALSSLRDSAAANRAQTAQEFYNPCDPVDEAGIDMPNGKHSAGRVGSVQAAPNASSSVFTSLSGVQAAPRARSSAGLYSGSPLSTARSAGSHGSATQRPAAVATNASHTQSQGRLQQTLPSLSGSNLLIDGLHHSRVGRDRPRSGSTAGSPRDAVEEKHAQLSGRGSSGTPSPRQLGPALSSAGSDGRSVRVLPPHTDVDHAGVKLNKPSSGGATNNLRLAFGAEPQPARVLSWGY